MLYCEKANMLYENSQRLVNWSKLDMLSKQHRYEVCRLECRGKSTILKEGFIDTLD